MANTGIKLTNLAMELDHAIKFCEEHPEARLISITQEWSGWSWHLLYSVPCDWKGPRQNNEFWVVQPSGCGKLNTHRRSEALEEFVRDWC